MRRIQQGYGILKASELENGMWAASTSDDYSFTWFRDTAYIALTYLDKDCDTFERAYAGILNILRDYEWKLDILNKQRPTEEWQYLHIRYNAETFKEVNVPWGHVQYDAYGSILYGIGEGEKRGKKIIRDEKDREVIQKLVGFLELNEYYNDLCSSLWEETREVRSSSLGAVVAGLEAISDIVYVPSELISKGYEALYKLFPNEAYNRDADLAQLTLIYPYRLLSKPLAQKIIGQVEDKLLKDKAVLRYEGDSYYSTLEKEHGRHMSLEFYHGSEAQWSFGLSFLALSHMVIGDMDKAKYYIERTEKLILENGSIPELYFAGDYKDERGNNYNTNTPLVWANSMHIQAVEMYLRESDMM